MIRPDPIPQERGCIVRRGARLTDQLQAWVITTWAEGRIYSGLIISGPQRPPSLDEIWERARRMPGQLTEVFPL